MAAQRAGLGGSGPAILQLNKTDANDALGLAQVVRTGWYREVAVNGMDAHALRLLLVARAALITQRQAVANTVRGLLKTFGIVIPRGAGAPFAARVREAAEGNPTLAAIIEPMLVAWGALREGVLAFDRQVLAKTDAAARRLMTIPGVGAVVALAYAAVVDDPAPVPLLRFRRRLPRPDTAATAPFARAGHPERFRARTPGGPPPRRRGGARRRAAPRGGARTRGGLRRRAAGS